jgi:nucleoside-diphosphate-sugar epimerase
MTGTTGGLRVAVTGGSGRVGGHVTRALRARGHRVVNIDLRQAARPRAPLVRIDLRRAGWVAQLLRHVEAVVHLGEIPDLGGLLAPEEVLAHNTAVGAVVLETAADLGLRHAVYASSCQIYGMWGEGAAAAPRCLPFDETHPPAPAQAYAASKLANERFAARMAAERGLSVTALRLPAVITSWPTAAELRGGHPALRRFAGPLDGFGTYVHADDVADACAAALERARPGFEVYHLTAGEVACARPLRDLLRAEHPAWPELPPDWPPFASPASCDKAAAQLGWAPRFDLVDVFREAFGHDPGAGPGEPLPASLSPPRA